MRRSPFLLVAGLLLQSFHVQAKAVFAHFMISNSVNYSSSDWADDVSKAQAAKIDAFALNIAHAQDGNDAAIAAAFTAVAGTSLQLFFSFDYAGNGAWPKAEVIALIQKYGGNAAHYQYGGGPFVSTFEGPDNADDWHDIKGQTGCFFVPDWSSLGAKFAMEAGNGVADGLFSWAAWPWGGQDMNTFVDASYLQYLNGKPYMMPVSPWFYTNLPGYSKDWLWRSDNLWFDRWEEVLYVQPEWVEVISWNDYGESHYIGPIRSNALGALSTGKAPFDYVTNMPHDAWRDLMPLYSDLYTSNATTVTQERVVYWHRNSPAAACNNGQTTANTASQLEVEFDAASVVEDSVFFAAILSSNAQVSVSIGGSSTVGSWIRVPDGGAGVYYGSVPFNGRTGAVTVTLSRGGATGTGSTISTSCVNGMTNWNPWVGEVLGGSTSFSLNMDNLVCINGTSVGNFMGLCEKACSLGYCPIGACLCKAMGQQKEKPDPLNIDGYPAAGLDANYAGLCSFDCNMGYCPPEACATVSSPLTIATVSPFTPNACTSGQGPDPWSGLCSYACNWGFCPTQLCECLTQGVLHDPPAVTKDVTAWAVGHVGDYEYDWGICQFACSRGYCPPPCDATASGGSGSIVYIDPSLWGEPTPLVGCDPPCVLVLPPVTLPSVTTITVPPLTTTLTESWVSGSQSTTVTTITFPEIVTSVISVYNVNITDAGVTTATYTVTPSLTFVGTIKVTPPPGVQASTTLTYNITTTKSTTLSSESTVSFTSTTAPSPTCTSSSGCGKVCTSHCNDCNSSGCSCGGCCSGCGGDDGTGGTGGHLGCIGLLCLPPIPPIDGGGGGGGGSDGDGGDDDDDCSSKTTVTDCTSYCTWTSVSGDSTMDTTCGSSSCGPTARCDATATTTTSFTSEGCPALVPYTPLASNTGAIPSPGDAVWGGLDYGTGTYSATNAAAATTATPTPTPTPTTTSGSGGSGSGGGQTFCYSESDCDSYPCAKGTSPTCIPANIGADSGTCGCR